MATALAATYIDPTITQGCIFQATTGELQDVFAVNTWHLATYGLRLMPAECAIHILEHAGAAPPANIHTFLDTERGEYREPRATRLRGPHSTRHGSRR